MSIVTELEQSRQLCTRLYAEAEKVGGRANLDPAQREKLFAEETFLNYDVTKAEATEYAHIAVAEVGAVGTRHELGPELSHRYRVLELVIGSRTLSREEADQLARLERRAVETEGGISGLPRDQQKEVVLLRALASDRYARADAQLFADLWEERVQSPTGRLEGSKETVYFDLQGRQDATHLRISEGRRRPTFVDVELPDLAKLFLK